MSFLAIVIDFLNLTTGTCSFGRRALAKKEAKRVGLTPVGLVGSRDQHSFLQLIMDGVKDKSVTFIKIKDHASDKTIPNLSLKGLEECDFVAGLSLNELINLQCDATAMALVQEGISVDTITLERLDEFHAGWLIFYYELLPRPLVSC